MLKKTPAKPSSEDGVRVISRLFLANSRFCHIEHRTSHTELYLPDACPCLRLPIFHLAVGAGFALLLYLCDQQRHITQVLTIILNSIHS